MCSLGSGLIQNTFEIDYLDLANHWDSDIGKSAYFCLEPIANTASLFE